MAFKYNSSLRYNFHIEISHLRRHLGFGMYFQTGNLIQFIKDSVMPIYIGGILGTNQLGFVNWSHVVATYGVLLIIPLSRIYLPVFSDLSREKIR